MLTLMLVGLLIFKSNLCVLHTVIGDMVAMMQIGTQNLHHAISRVLPYAVCTMIEVIFEEGLLN